MANIFKDKIVFVAGGGHFGTEAIKSLRASSAKVILVDTISNCKASKFADEKVNGCDIDEAFRIESNSVKFFLCDAVELLNKIIRRATPDHIVPAIPGHLAGEVVKRWLEEEGFKLKGDSETAIEVLNEIPKSLVMSYNKETGRIVTSYMPEGRLCNLPCDQPIDFCRTTGRKKAGPMYSILEFATWKKAEISKIIHSYKLQRDVGCFKGEDIVSFLSELKNIKTPYSLAIGTSCSCHGVLNLFLVN